MNYIILIDHLQLHRHNALSLYSFKLKTLIFSTVFFICNVMKQLNYI